MIENIIKYFMDFVKYNDKKVGNRTLWSLAKEWLNEFIKTAIFLIGLAGIIWILRHF